MGVMSAWVTPVPASTFGAEDWGFELMASTEVGENWRLEAPPPGWGELAP